MDWGTLSDDYDRESLFPSGNSTGFMNEHLFVGQSFNLSTDRVFSAGESSQSRSTLVNLDTGSNILGFLDEDSTLVGCPDPLKPSVPSNTLFQSPNNSQLEPIAGPSGSAVSLAEENDEGTCGSSEVLRLPRKRKSSEVPVCDQSTVSNTCPGSSSGYNGSTGGSSWILERFSRNLHSRFDAPIVQSPDFVVGPELVSSNPGLLLSQEPSASDMNDQEQPPEIHFPAFPPNGPHHDPVAGSDVSRVEADGNSSNTLENHQLFVPVSDTRTLASWSTGGLSIHTPRNLSVSQSVTSSPIQPPVPNRPMRYPRRFSEYVRRSLCAVGSEPGGGPNSSSPVVTGPSGSSQDLLVSTRDVSSSSSNRSSGSSSNLPRRSLPTRSSSGTERQGAEAVPGVPFSLRDLPITGEVRRRLASEVRGILDMLSTAGQALPFQDFTVLHQSVLSGLAGTRDRHRDMRLDVDNMSYEELLALEERIGNVSTGLSEETILVRLKQRKRVLVNNSSQTEPCCICQEEYNEGDDLGMLQCGHDFHTACIKQWLMRKNICPICKTTGLS